MDCIVDMLPRFVPSTALKSADCLLLTVTKNADTWNCLFLDLRSTTIIQARQCMLRLLFSLPPTYNRILLHWQFIMNIFC